MPTQLFKFFCGSTYLGENSSLLIGKDIFKDATKYEYWENGKLKSERMIHKEKDLLRAFDTLKRQHIFLN